MYKVIGQILNGSSTVSLVPLWAAGARRPAGAAIGSDDDGRCTHARGAARTSSRRNGENDLAYGQRRGRLKH